MSRPFLPSADFDEGQTRLEMTAAQAVPLSSSSQASLETTLFDGRVTPTSEQTTTIAPCEVLLLRLAPRNSFGFDAGHSQAPHPFAACFLPAACSVVQIKCCSWEMLRACEGRHEPLEALT